MHRSYNNYVKVYLVVLWIPKQRAIDCNIRGKWPWIISSLDLLSCCVPIDQAPIMGKFIKVKSSIIIPYGWKLSRDKRS